MLQLPKDIDEKIQKLPVIGFGDSEAFQQILFSDDFTDIFNYYKVNYLPDVLKTKPEIEQKISLYLSLTNQDESFIEQTDQILYKRPVPDIQSFLNDKFYMYYSNATLYPYWKDKLETIFAKDSPIRKVIFSGCIGSGKSTIARKAFIYILYRILCLRYPRAAFNIDGDSTIANIVISMTLKQVYDTNLLPFVKLMESMPCFQHVMSARAFENFDLTNPRCPFPYYVEKSSGTIFFPDNIIITCGSNQGHFTGYNVVNSFCLAGDCFIYTTKGNIAIKELARRFKNNEKFQTLGYNGELVDIINVKKTKEVIETIKIWIDDINYIECTPNHLFLIKNPTRNDLNIQYIHNLPFKEAQYLTENDEIEELQNNPFDNFYKKYSIDITRLTRDYLKQPRKEKETVLKSDLEYLYKICNVRREDLSIYFGFSTSTLDRLIKKYKIKKDKSQYTQLRFDTNCKKYGGNSPFCSSITHEKAKITYNKHYGVSNPSFVPEIRRKAENTCLKKYGNKTVLVIPEFKEKSNKTNLKKYGCKNVFSNKEIQKRIQQTNLQRYGVKNPMQCKDIQKKVIKTCLKKYGVKNSFQTKKTKETCLQKYGVDNYSKTEEWKNKVKETNLYRYGVQNAAKNRDIINKGLQTKRINQSFNKSEPEEKIYNLLLKKFSKVKRQYKSKEYPFACDFYIAPLDLYIEYQGMWTHGKEPYNENKEEHKKIIEKWKNKNSKFYNMAIEVWTKRDPVKRQIAEKNNLNWLEFFNLDQFMRWYNEN